MADSFLCLRVGLSWEGTAPLKLPSTLGLSAICVGAILSLEFLILHCFADFAKGASALILHLLPFTGYT